MEMQILCHLSACGVTYSLTTDYGLTDVSGLLSCQPVTKGAMTVYDRCRYNLSAHIKLNINALHWELTDDR